MNGAGVDLVQAKLSASDLINAYDYKATNQRYYPDLGRLRHQYGISWLVAHTSVFATGRPAEREETAVYSG